MALFFEESSEVLRDSYSEYLRDSQVVPKLLDILKKLEQADEKPKNPLNFIRQELGDTPIPMETLLNMERELEDARNEIRRLQTISKRLGINYEKDNFADVFIDSNLQPDNVDDCSIVE